MNENLKNETMSRISNMLKKQEDERPENLINYKKGVETLIKVALEQDGSGAHAAAQVLLGCYNGNNYHLDIIDLGLLDGQNFEYAMAVIRGRQLTFEEPHNVIENGREQFNKLQEHYQHLKIQNRYKKYY